MSDLDAVEIHHEDCHVRSMRHVFKEPECNCTVELLRKARERVATLESCHARITSILEEALERIGTAWEDQVARLHDELAREHQQVTTLEDGIEDLRERIISGANELDRMAGELEQTKSNVRPHIRLLAKAEGLRVALDYARLLDVSHVQKDDDE